MDTFDCAICLELLCDPRVISCGHTFCKSCLEQLRPAHRQCPICMRAFESPQALPPNYVLLKYLEEWERERKGGGKAKEGAKKNLEIDEMFGNTKKMCERLIQEMMNNRRSLAFNQPVDYELLDLPDYPNIITEPMDLGTILDHLRKHKFKTLKEFSSKVRLVFNNARTFNSPGSRIYYDAVSLTRLFEIKYMELQETLGLPEEYDPPKEISMKRKRVNSSVSPKAETKQKTEPIKQPLDSCEVSRDEKIALHAFLTQNICNLPLMTKVATTLCLDFGFLTPLQDVEVDLELLPPTTLKQLQRIVEAERLNNPQRDQQSESDSDSSL